MIIESLFESLGQFCMFDHTHQVITLSVITLSRLHCITINQNNTKISLAFENNSVYEYLRSKMLVSFSN